MEYAQDVLEFPPNPKHSHTGINGNISGANLKLSSESEITVNPGTVAKRSIVVPLLTVGSNNWSSEPNCTMAATGLYLSYLRWQNCGVQG